MSALKKLDFYKNTLNQGARTESLVSSVRVISYVFTEGLIKMKAGAPVSVSAYVMVCGLIPSIKTVKFNQKNYRIVEIKTGMAKMSKLALSEETAGG